MGWQIRTTPEIAAAIQETAGLYGVDPAFVAAVIRVESNFNPNAENPADPSYGLMQVTPLIARAYGGWAGTDPQEIKTMELNLRAGVGFLAHLLARYGDPDAAIQAYNLGESKYDRGLTSPTYLASVRQAATEFGSLV